MVRPTDQEAIDIEKIVCYCFQEEPPGFVRSQKEQRENINESLYCAFCGKEQARPGKQA